MLFYLIFAINLPNATFFQNIETEWKNDAPAGRTKFWRWEQEGIFKGALNRVKLATEKREIQGEEEKGIQDGVKT